MTLQKTEIERIESILNRKDDKTCLQRHARALLVTSAGTVAADKQRHFMHTNKPSVELGFRMMIEGAEMYLEGLKRDYELRAGEDCLIASELGCILNSLLELLNGPGNFDGGTIDGAIRNIARNYKLTCVQQ